MSWCCRRSQNRGQHGPRRTRRPRRRARERTRRRSAGRSPHPHSRSRRALRQAMRRAADWVVEEVRQPKHSESCGGQRVERLDPPLQRMQPLGGQKGTDDRTTAPACRSTTSMVRTKDSADAAARYGPGLVTVFIDRSAKSAPTLRTTARAAVSSTVTTTRSRPSRRPLVSVTARPPTLELADGTRRPSRGSCGAGSFRPG